MMNWNDCICLDAHGETVKNSGDLFSLKQHTLFVHRLYTLSMVLGNFVCGLSEDRDGSTAVS